MAGATGAKCRQDNKVKATAVEVLGEGLIENVEMSKSVGGSDEHTMNSASAPAKSADCPLETAQCRSSFS